MAEAMADITVERATAEDASGIETLVREARINPTSLHWQNFCVARHVTLGLVGCGQIRDAPFGTGRELKSLVVRREFRNGAVARALLRKLMENERGVVWGTCLEALAPYYLRLGCEIPPRREVPLYYRVMGAVAARIHRRRTGQAPKMVVMRYRPKRPDGR